MQVKHKIGLALLIACIAAAPPVASALETYYRIQSFWKPGQEVNVQTGIVDSTATKPGWWSADWAIEPAGNGSAVRVRNRWKGSYLNVENGQLQASAIQPGWQSAMWLLEPVSQGVYRIRNKWQTGAYLNIENGHLEASAVQPGWNSAMWRIRDARGQDFKATAAAPAYKPVASGNTAAVGVVANTAAGRQMLASPGKQCVKARFGIGYVARVRWYEPRDVIYEPTSQAISVRPGASTYKDEKIAVLQTSCVQTRYKMVAQVSVVGGDIANEAITLAAGTAVAVSTGVAGAFVCVGTAGTACPAAVAGVSAAVSGAVSAAAMALPDAKATFYIGAPGKLELSGTVWNPRYKEVREFGKGKPVGAKCDSDGQCANNTCARESAAKGNTSICCPSGREGMYSGHEYCYGMAPGTTCWSDAMCASGNCKGNALGTRRGHCK